MLPPNLLGLVLGLVSSIIWGGHGVLARIAVGGGAAGQGFVPLDLLFFRYLPSALVLAPLAWRYRAVLVELGWRRMLLLCLCGGAPNLLLFVTAMVWAPASHGGTIAPMTVPIAGALLAIPMLREWPTRGRAAALCAMAAGVVLIGWDGLVGPQQGAWIGDLLLIGAGATWGMFTLMLRRWRIPAIPSTAIIALLSAILVVPIWLVVRLPVAGSLPVNGVITQLIGQGLLMGVGAMFLYGKAVELLGATRAASLSVMVPVTGLTASAWFLAEPLTGLKLAGASLAVLGMLAAVLFTGRRQG
ncbi:EamA-like transporter family protein [Humitalea rosea]|uniref:EamA-like transporter family protein n=1 Tax=Humitalea rosea TaxID=990373 RepID=A0A2W7ITF8_9PROT|nr:DMT family transporter [Humitalea rosea]PZW49153.1 EamA-like transporter family protein [Humitalea rosea]